MPQPTSNPQPLRIVFLPPHRWDAPADSERSLKSPSNSALHELANLGERWRLLPPHDPPWNPLGRKNPFLRAIDPLRALRVMLFHRDADVVVSVFECNALVILLLRRVLFFRARVVLWDASLGNPWKLLRRIQRFVLPRYDGLLMLCTSQIEHLQREYRLTAPVGWLGYNVDERFFVPADEPDQGYVLMVGDDMSRDYATLMEAVRTLPEVPFVCKTRWRPRHGKAPPPNVRFVSERLDAPAFRDLYARARFVVLSLHAMEHAGGITALFEAMAMGKAQVVTDTAVTRDFVRHEEHALTTPVGDAPALARAVHRLWSDEELRQRLGRHARQRIEVELSTEQLAVRMRDFLRSLCGR